MHWVPPLVALTNYSNQLVNRWTLLTQIVLAAKESSGTVGGVSGPLPTSNVVVL